MYRIHLSLLIALIILGFGCTANPAKQPATPVFVTSVLPDPPTPYGTPTMDPTTGASREETNSTTVPIEGITTTQVNVRAGPSTAEKSMGTINIFTKVQVTGKDPSGKWIQIEFTNAPEGTGWVAIEYLQVSNIDSLLTIGGTEQIEQAPTNDGIISAALFPQALEDSDSMQAPMASAYLSSTTTRALQVNGDVSAPDGDTKDWVQFSSSAKAVILGVRCSNNALQIELWNSQVLVDTFLLACGNKQTLTLTPNINYFLTISEPPTGDHEHTNYLLKLELLR